MTLVSCIRGIQLAVVVAIAIATATPLAAAQEPVRRLVLHDSPRSVAAVQFTDQQGRARSLDDLRGKVVVLNIWATWCVPCRKEMPALDRLQGTLGGAELKVVPLSVDRGGLETVRKFYSEINLRNVAITPTLPDRPCAPWVPSACRPRSLSIVLVRKLGAPLVPPNGIRQKSPRRCAPS